MKNIFYLLAILFLSLLLACSEEPSTTVESETLSKDPVRPDPPPPLILLPGETHIIGEVRELIRGKYTESFRVWTKSNPVPQIRQLKGTDIKVAIYNVDTDPEDELLVYNYYVTGKNNNQVEHFELQIWKHGDLETPSLVIDLKGLLYLDIAIGELDNSYAGDEIVLGGYNIKLGYPEIRVFNPHFGDFKHPIDSFNVSAYGMFGRPVIIGDVAGDAANEIIFSPNSRGLVVLDYNSGSAKTYATPNNEQLNAIAVGYVEGIGSDEIIWGGNGGKIHILKLAGNDFVQLWESEYLGSSIMHLAAGDFDLDPAYEVAVSTLSSGNPSTIYVCESSQSSPPYYSISPMEIISEGVISMFAGNANNDPATKKGLVVGTRTRVKSYYTPPLPNFDVGALVPEVYLK